MMSIGNFSERLSATSLNSDLPAGQAEQEEPESGFADLLAASSAQPESAFPTATTFAEASAEARLVRQQAGVLAINVAVATASLMNNQSSASAPEATPSEASAITFESTADSAAVHLLNEQIEEALLSASQHRSESQITGNVTESSSTNITNQADSDAAADNEARPVNTDFNAHPFPQTATTDETVENADRLLRALTNKVFSATRTDDFSRLQQVTSAVAETKLPDQLITANFRLTRNDSQSRPDAFVTLPGLITKASGLIAELGVERTGQNKYAPEIGTEIPNNDTPELWPGNDLLASEVTATDLPLRSELVAAQTTEADQSFDSELVKIEGAIANTATHSTPVQAASQQAGRTVIANSADAQPVITQALNPLIELARSAGHNETRRLHFTLNPQELGRVEIEVRRDNEGRLTALLGTERNDAAKILAHGISHLREALEQAGLSVDRLDVFTAQQHNQTDDSSGHRHSHQNSAPQTEYLPTDQPTTDNSIATPEDRLLSLRA